MDNVALYQRHLTSCFAVVMIIAAAAHASQRFLVDGVALTPRWPCLSKPLQDDKGPVFGRCVCPLGEQTRHTGVFGISNTLINMFSQRDVHSNSVTQQV